MFRVERGSYPKVECENGQGEGKRRGGGGWVGG